jgi:hypothetical protein
VKTKRAAKGYICGLCEGAIAKGDRVARISVTIGYAGTWGHRKDCGCCDGVMPDWAYSDPVRDVKPICETCAENRSNPVLAKGQKETV